MRICYICNVDLSEENAAKIHILEVAEGLARRGHQVRLLAPALGRLREHAVIEVSYLPVRFGGWRLAAAYNAALAGYLPWIAADFRPDVYYVRESHRLAAPALAARATRTPLIVEVNGITVSEAAAVGLRPDRLARWAQRLLYRSAAGIIAVTGPIRDHVVQAYDVPAERVRVLPNGVNTRVYRPMDRDTVRAALGLGDGPIVGFIGHLEAWQGVDDLLRAVPLVLRCRPKTRFLMIGSGPREREYHALARALGVADAVHFTGQVPTAEAPCWINAFDVAVALKRPLASGYSPLKLYSYLACGQPIVASRVQGFEEVEGQGAGVLVDGVEPASVAGAILRLLDCPEERERMGAAGRALAMERHSWDHVVDETERLCRAVSGGRG